MTARKPLDADRFLAEVEAGEHDDRLVDLVMFARARAMAQGGSMRWRISIDGETWDEDTVTVGEMVAVETLTGRPWGEIDSPLMSATVAANLILAHFVKIKDEDTDTASKRVEALRVAEVLAAVSEYESEQPAPKSLTE